jgi:NAD(P)H-hydrate epimerase
MTLGASSFSVAADAKREYARGMNSPALTRDQCRELDRRAIEDYGIASLVLMENAGRGCVDVLERLVIDGPVVVLCGKGNNAGDGFVIARHLEIRGYNCRVLLLFPPNALTGDAAINLNILQRSGACIIDLSAQRAGASSPPANANVVAGLPTEPLHRPQVSVRSAEETCGRESAGSGDPRTTDLIEALNVHAHDAAWLIDAMLGTGAVGAPRPPFDSAIDWMNAQPCKKLAVDVPSGLDCDTGQPATHTVLADHTCTFAAMKVGFTHPSAKAFTGTIHVCDIGVPPQLLAESSRQQR